MHNENESHFFYYRMNHGIIDFLEESPLLLYTVYTQSIKLMLSEMFVQENEVNDHNLSNFRLKVTIEINQFSSFIFLTKNLGSIKISNLARDIEPGVF